MFENIARKFQEIFREVRGTARLSESNIAATLREVRLALLEADVNFRLVKEIVEKVREESLGDEVLRSIKPGQQFIKLIHDELVRVMTCPGSGLELSGAPAVIMLLGLQGAGKTTTAAKLGRYLARQGRRPLLAACDVARPAAARQLQIVGDSAGIETWVGGEGDSAFKRASDAIDYASEKDRDLVILDTAGRLHVDSALMKEAAGLKARFRPCQVLLVLDAMTGQDALSAAREFENQVGIDGAILTKLDGDARGGAAISVSAVTGKPVKLASTGEKLDDFGPFDPERMASRILGMGDIVGLVERAAEIFEGSESEKLEESLRKGSFNLEDFRRQLKALQKAGSWDSLAGMLPGAFSPGALDEGRLKRMGAILDSMTPKERALPGIIDGSRRARIARGSGTSVREINQLLKQFAAARKMMTDMGKFKRGKMKFNLGGANWPLS